MLQIPAENVDSLFQGKFNFKPEKILNKALIFNTSHIDEKKTMNKLIQSLPGDNDELYIEHEPGTNVFVLKH